MVTKSKARSRFRAPKSPEEIAALQEQRRLKKEADANKPPPSTPGAALLERAWIPFTVEGESNLDLKILTWNILAQCLVRRELFPTSNCLKVGQREPMIHQEIQRLDADVLCLQEVDRMDKLGPMLEAAGYSYRYATGPKKLHGCLIAFKASKFVFDEEKVVYYDDEDVRSEGGEAHRRGKSFQTRNIGLIVAVKRKENPVHGVIVSTTHLFWHPRQAGILVREVARFKAIDLGRQNWPCIMAGDFNFPPDDPGYSLLTGFPLLPGQKDRLLPSYVVHRTVDPSIAQDQPQVAGDTEEGGEAEAVDPDRVITNARPAQPSDGLLATDELVSFHGQNLRARSAYAIGSRNHLATLSDPSKSDNPIYGSHNTVPEDRPGYYEPKYTSYTHYWQSVLDYIFVLGDSQFQVAGFLAALEKEALEPGLPQKGVCGSDHLPLVTQLKFAV
ncbi:hypothetical protein CC1G_06782 [Coprinopsis cinerea okayama7|uniref:Endonuclease/exonuclease/phosphatase domain-containing protein n=1 Tax=Coprinopsis cinerea (strain Okayama-7 / 130 / ATCC MYA-4618 / FGSC 9003) TaxID=240176 RepID=A8N1M3_COPC7|nr:hypothetical protein CC1G_06782 [Coprinopsis cinerea okayama7\|eukprot:XP_001828796.2 hypothetical protein CC1G_06782 [Coprinopsis cinerea okayama7\